MLKYMLSTAAASLLACSAAVAAPPPVAPGLQQLNSSIVSEVQQRRDARPRRQSQRRYVPGRRYKSAPRGYRRYGSRPHDWQRRGCIIVGPVWFCP